MSSLTNECGKFGKWACDISYHIADVDGIVKRWAEDV